MSILGLYTPHIFSMSGVKRGVLEAEIEKSFENILHAKNETELQAASKKAQALIQRLPGTDLKEMYQAQYESAFSIVASNLETTKKGMGYVKFKEIFEKAGLTDKEISKTKKQIKELTELRERNKLLDEEIKNQEEIMKMSSEKIAKDIEKINNEIESKKKSSETTEDKDLVVVAELVRILGETYGEQFKELQKKNTGVGEIFKTYINYLVERKEVTNAWEIFQHIILKKDQLDEIFNKK
jgi:Na+/phosphate symporter